MLIALKSVFLIAPLTAPLPHYQALPSTATSSTHCVSIPQPPLPHYWHIQPEHLCPCVGRCVLSVSDQANCWWALIQPSAICIWLNVGSVSHSASFCDAEACAHTNADYFKDLQVGQAHLHTSTRSCWCWFFFFLNCILDYVLSQQKIFNAEWNANIQHTFCDTSAMHLCNVQQR